MHSKAFHHHYVLYDSNHYCDDHYEILIDIIIYHLSAIILYIKLALSYSNGTVLFVPSVNFLFFIAHATTSSP